mmetsp:Transcript_28548/g.71548  ORF Transcript_28548/g.71548 Transcript_28548/m.71548 type:complete len:168 (+) Transcript_28548:97-600(+)|eukprot:jgi/Tetstr1/448581/TSEL_035830.t1
MAKGAAAAPATESVTADIPSILSQCRALITSVPYTARGAHPASFVTVDEDGFPSARLVVPTSASEALTDFVINTRADTRKVQEIRAGGRNASLVWTSQKGKQGWLTIKGLVSCGGVGNNERLDIHFEARKIEVMSYNQADLKGDDSGFKPLILERADGEGRFWKRVH